MNLALMQKVLDNDDHSSNNTTNSKVSNNWSPTSSEGEFPEDHDQDVTLKFINQILMEEDFVTKTSGLAHQSALQAYEKSFYDALGQEYPSPHNSISSNSSCETTDSLPSTSQDQNPHFCCGDVEGGTKNDKGRRNRAREDNDDFEDERGKKHSAIRSDEAELSEIFDEVLLCYDPNEKSEICETDEDESSKKSQQTRSGRTKRVKGQGNKRDKSKKEMVDLTILLTQCAQSVANNDHRTAREHLKIIRQHSSPLGDGTERLAHCFANGLETRLAGTNQSYPSIVANRRPTSHILKAYHVYISTCPFKKVSNMLANRTIVSLAEKATSLHIVDFGIMYGFQWPCLIQRLSSRPGGPPKLRITGIDFPEPGFRPTDRVLQSGRRLADYCKRFGVPFEYNGIAQKWETIRVEDFKIEGDEFLVVNSLYRFKSLLDETVTEDSPRDAVLGLIKAMNPRIFIHGVANGTYHTPFFVTRFREALFHFSALFDMFEACVPRGDEARMMFETEIFGKDAMNVIACEGSERIERPETYKQWQVRNIRAGFKQVPLNGEIMNMVRAKVKSGYHKDFMVGEDGNWMFQGWKGRIIYALSCWKAA